jgi:oligosaccharide reducing-end xylanase
MNIGLDAAWFKNADQQPEPGVAPSDFADQFDQLMGNLQTFFSEKTRFGEYHNYTIRGEALDQPALHPVAIIATNAACSQATTGPHRMDWVRHFWNQPLRKGDRRYYDNCLYFFSLLMLAGKYQVFMPEN